MGATVPNPAGTVHAIAGRACADHNCWCVRGDGGDSEPNQQTARIPAMGDQQDACLPVVGDTAQCIPGSVLGVDVQRDVRGTAKLIAAAVGCF